MFNFKYESKKTKIFLIASSLIFLAFCIFSSLKYGESCLMGSIQKGDNDDVRYIRSAFVLIDEHKFISQRVNELTCYMMPGITFILSFFMLIFGKMQGIIAFRIFQGILQFFSLYLIYFIARKFFGIKTGIAAVLIDEFYSAEIYAQVLILTEVTFKFLVLLLIYISLYALETKKYKYYIEGGFLLGIACYVRPTIAMFPLVILIMWLIKKYSIKEMIKFASIVSIIFCIILSPWWIRNYNVFHRFIPLTLSTGNPFLQGTYINYNTKKDSLPYVHTTNGKSIIEINSIEIETGKEKLKRDFKKEPVQYIYWYTIGKLIYMWNLPFYWQEISGISMISAVLYHYFIVLIPGMLGIYFAIKNIKNYVYPLLCFAYLNAVYLPYFTCSRYAYPAAPLLIIFSALYIQRKWIKQKE